MRRKLPQIEIESPCSQSWDGMRRDGRARFCAACGKSVYNLAAMTPREVERLTLRAAIGDSVCAQVRYREGELVTLEAGRALRTPLAAGAALSAALVASIPMAAQGGAPPTDSAVLTGTVGVAIDGHGVHPSSIVLLKGEDTARFGMIRPDGTFEVHAPPGTYEISIAGMDFVEHGVVLHEGLQSVGEVTTTPKAIDMTTGGAIAIRIGPMYWARHPLGYARYLGRRIRRSFNS